jgi:hypothetical protein
MSHNEIRIIPKNSGNLFQGFEVKGRRPENILEWAHATLAMAHFGFETNQGSQEPTFLAIHDDPLHLFEDALLTLPVVDHGFSTPNREKFGAFALGAAVVRIEREIAVGAILFPGAPHLGIGHTATVVHIDVTGQVHRMITDDNASTTIDPDIAVLSSALVGSF